MLFTASYSLNQINSKNSENQSIFSGIKFSESLDYSSKGNYSILTRPHLKRMDIYSMPSTKSNFVNTTKIRTLENIGKPNCVAVDWIHDLIYWIDIESSTIKVFNFFQPEFLYTISNLTYGEPRDLVVNVLKSILVWNEIENISNIKQSLQDGTNQTVLYSGYKTPFHLTIDYESKKYYFIEIRTYTLFSIDFEGENEKMVLKSPTIFHSVNSMAFIGEEIYLSTGNSILRLTEHLYGIESVDVVFKTYKSIPKFNDRIFFDNNSNVLMREEIYAMKIIDDSLQPYSENKCEFANCSHLCLPYNSFGFRCVCPLNMVLIDGSFCQHKGLVSQITTQTTETSTESYTETKIDDDIEFETELNTESVNELTTIEEITERITTVKKIDLKENDDLLDLRNTDSNRGQEILTVVNLSLIAILIIVVIILNYR
jgi:hypothetical protein